MELYKEPPSEAAKLVHVKEGDQLINEVDD
jgi:hypothetical protein